MSRFWCCVLWLCVVCGSGGNAAAADVDFAHDIVPVLRQYCGACHTGAKKQGGLSMNSRVALLAGGENGAVLKSGASADSELIRRLESQDESLRMPPEGPRVPAEKVALLKRWIDEGAKWEDGFSFAGSAWEPPLKLHRPELPAARNGRTHPVDRIVDEYLAGKNMAVPESVDDAAFLRRVSLDVTGLLPTQEQREKFLADPRSDRRGRLVDQLLDDDIAYAEHWLTFWNDLLRNDYSGTGFITGGRRQITGWLYRSLVENKPFDAMIRELIVASPESEGFIQGIRWRGNVSASQANEVQFAQSISQAFLGINMKCASCHDSFVDHWKLDDAYGLAAIYATTPLEVHRCDKPTGAKAVAKWIFPELGQIDPAAPQPERMKQLAALMTHPDNGRVPRTIVNRLWHRLMGRGIVHPVDAMHTEPWSAVLLDHLAVHLQDENYNLKETIRLICTSQIYQAQTPAVTDEGEGAAFVFRGPVARRMSAEQFVDAVWQLTGAAPSRADAQVIRAKLPPVERAVSDGASTDETKPRELAGQWVWSRPDAARGNSAGGETITLRRRFDLKAVPVRAVAVITCDNAYTLWLNGRQIGSDDAWENVELYPLESALKAGANELLIVAKNGGSGPNPAGLYFEALWQQADGVPGGIATGTEWEWTVSVPDARGRFRMPPDDWQPAAVIPAPQVWVGVVRPQMVSLLTAGVSGSARMVRASLVKSDELMRALGRPNRDQIVTMRPSELTTLEAISLANGQSLADAVARGAVLWQLRSETDRAGLVEAVYLAALSREPSGDERDAALNLMEEASTAESVEDLLWAILMLPEFQLIR